MFFLSVKILVFYLQETQEQFGRKKVELEQKLLREKAELAKVGNLCYVVPNSIDTDLRLATNEKNSKKKSKIEMGKNGKKVKINNCCFWCVKRLE